VRDRRHDREGGEDEPGVAEVVRTLLRRHPEFVQEKHRTPRKRLPKNGFTGARPSGPASTTTRPPTSRVLLPEATCARARPTPRLSAPPPAMRARARAMTMAGTSEERRHESFVGDPTRVEIGQYRDEGDGRNRSVVGCKRCGVGYACDEHSAPPPAPPIIDETSDRPLVGDISVKRK